METVVLVIILLVCFNFVLKQTYRKLWMVGAISLLCALFVAFAWPWAIEQSKSQIQDWLNNPQLMLDTAVVLFIEVVIQMAYCLMAVHLMNTGKVRRRTLFIYKLLRWFPGLLIFPVLFHIETQCMFWLTGMEFSTVAYGLAAIVFVVILLFTWAIRWLIPEKELRLEIFLLSNALIAILGIIATVNGRTAVAGISEVNWAALACMAGLTLLFAIVGFILYRMKKMK
ncbi:MAG: hypothetical protein IJ610_11400 [Bacteroidaceae bacterium]|nr:hypothetical protein [Bacteroidaceae bacterium]